MPDIVEIRPPINVASSVRKFGYNADIDAFTGPNEDITTFGNAYWPTTAVAAADIDIASSSTEDDPNPAGTGAYTMVIEGLDGDYMQQSETITLNGQTDVHPVNDYLRIFRAHVATHGGANTNVGTITIDNGAGNVMAQILAGFGQTLQAAYTIPADYQGAYLLKWEVSVINKTAAYIGFILQVHQPNTAWLTKEIIGVNNGVPFEYKFEFPNFYPAKTDLVITAFDASADNLAASAGFELMLKR